MASLDEESIMEASLRTSLRQQATHATDISRTKLFGLADVDKSGVIDEK